MPGVAYGGIAWGDYDADGDLDVVLTGSTVMRFTPLTKIYRNDAGAFTDINAALTPLVLGDAAWGDFDNDGDLDALLSRWDAILTAPGFETVFGASAIYENINAIFMIASGWKRRIKGNPPASAAPPSSRISMAITASMFWPWAIWMAAFPHLSPIAFSAIPDQAATIRLLRQAGCRQTSTAIRSLCIGTRRTMITPLATA
jgi:hypothetical protein